MSFRKIRGCFRFIFSTYVQARSYVEDVMWKPLGNSGAVYRKVRDLIHTFSCRQFPLVSMSQCTASIQTDMYSDGSCIILPVNQRLFFRGRELHILYVAQLDAHVQTGHVLTYIQNNVDVRTGKRSYRQIYLSNNNIREDIHMYAYIRMNTKHR